MRLSPRRRTDGDDAPSRGPVAAYAGILDGRHLWLTLESGEHRRAARRATGDDASTSPATSPTCWRCCRPATRRTTSCRAAERVWGPPPPTGDPTRVPVSPDGLTQLGLDRTESGHLRVDPARGRARPHCWRRSSSASGEAHLTLRPPGDVEPGTHLLLLDGDRPAPRPAARHRPRRPRRGAGRRRDLPAGYFGVVRLALGTEDSWVRIRRRRSDLADPHRAVLLPELHDTGPEADAEEDAPRARFRWNPDSHLVAPGPRPGRADRAGRDGHPDGGPRVKIAYLVLSAYAMGGTERSAITQANALAADARRDDPQRAALGRRAALRDRRAGHGPAPRRRPARDRPRTRSSTPSRCSCPAGGTASSRRSPTSPSRAPSARSRRTSWSR